MKTNLRVLMLVIALFGCLSPCWAANCGLNVQGVNFGSYDVFATDASDSTGNIDVACDVQTTFAVTLSTGAGTYALRKMSYSAHMLNYNLYTNVARTDIWGDGTAGTVVQSVNARLQSFTVYGRVPAKQNVYAGSYSDNLMVTVSF